MMVIVLSQVNLKYLLNSKIRITFLEEDDENEYNNNIGPELLFTENGVQDEIKLSNAREEYGIASINIIC